MILNNKLTQTSNQLKFIKFDTRFLDFPRARPIAAASKNALRGLVGSKSRGSYNFKKTPPEGQSVDSLLTIPLIRATTA
jgi:hypothetical protein